MFVFGVVCGLAAYQQAKNAKAKPSAEHEELRKRLQDAETKAQQMQEFLQRQQEETKRREREQVDLLFFFRSRALTRSTHGFES